MTSGFISVPEPALTSHEPCVEWIVDGQVRSKALRGRLPRDTYRVVVRGGFVGPSFELELKRRFPLWTKHVIVLDPGPQEAGMTEEARVQRAALEEISRRHGTAAAQRAQIRMIWDGSL